MVAGIRNTTPIAEMQKEFPDVYKQFLDICNKLENHYKDMQDVEFTIEEGKFWMLQTRNGKRTAKAAVKIAVDMVNEGLISKDEAVQRVSPDQVNTLLHPQFEPKAAAEARNDGKFFTHGVNASPGAAVGRVYFDADTAERMAKEAPGCHHGAPLHQARMTCTACWPPKASSPAKAAPPPTLRWWLASSAFLAWSAPQRSRSTCRPAP